MPWGDVREEQSEASSSYVDTITVGPYTATPVANDLNICCAFTGETTVNLPTGFLEGVQVTNGTEDDDSELSYQLVVDSGDDRATPTSSGVDAFMAELYLIAGEFDASPKDVSHSAGRDDATPTATGASSATAQADEFLLAYFAARYNTSHENQTGDWTREGTATPTADMTASSQGTTKETVDGVKSLSSASQVLTATGTMGVSKAWTGANLTIGMVGICSFKKAGAGAYDLVAAAGSYSVAG